MTLFYVCLFVCYLILFIIISWRPDCFLSRDRKGADLDGRVHG